MQIPKPVFLITKPVFLILKAVLAIKKQVCPDPETGFFGYTFLKCGKESKYKTEGDFSQKQSQNSPQMSFPFIWASHSLKASRQTGSNAWLPGQPERLQPFVVAIVIKQSVEGLKDLRICTCSFPFLSSLEIRPF